VSALVSNHRKAVICDASSSSFSPDNSISEAHKTAIVMLSRLSTLARHFPPHTHLRTYAAMAHANLKPLKLYSLATPNGVKVTTFLEDLKNEYGLQYECVRPSWPIMQRD
jgi:hypothetical protein